MPNFFFHLISELIPCLTLPEQKNISVSVVFLAMPCVPWDLSSSTRGQTRIPYIGNTGAAGKPRASLKQKGISGPLKVTFHWGGHGLRICAQRIKFNPTRKLKLGRGMWKSRANLQGCFWSVVLEKTLESPLDCKESQPVHSKGNQSWMFIGRTDAEAETPVLWPPGAESWLIGKDLMLGKIEGRRRRGRQNMRLLDGITNSMGMSLNWWWTGRPGMLQSMGSQRVGHDWVIELTDWMEKQS